MMNNINNVKRKSMDFKTPYSIFVNIYGENIVQILHLHHIDEKDVDLSYKILKQLTSKNKKTIDIFNTQKLTFNF